MKNKLIAAALALLLCVGCAVRSSDPGVPPSSATEEPTVSALSAAQLFTDRDLDPSYTDCVNVTLADGASTADGGGVSIDGDRISLSQDGVYRLTGALSDGQIIVEAADTAKVQLVLDGASIACAGGAAIYVKAADKVFLTLAENTENALRSGGEFVQTDDNNVDAAVFSKADLTLNGSGSLTVVCESGHGVVSKDDLAVTGGDYQITAASQGLSGKDSVRIADGVFVIESGTDGIHSENADDAAKGFVYLLGGDFTITSGTDGVDASGSITISDGQLRLLSGGGSANAAVKTDSRFGGGMGGQGGTRPTGTPPTDGNTTDALPESSAATADAATSDSCKGLKSDTGITITGGDFTIDSADDALHTNGSLHLAGGSFSLTSGDDGIHADAALEISGGDIEIVRSYEGLEGASISLSGGNVSVTASDDGLNAAGGNDGSSISGRAGQNSFDADVAAFIAISGGSLTVSAEGDGIDSNGDLAVSGGTIYISGPTNSGNGALDYAGSGVITGGVLVAAGSAGMAQSFGSDSTQGAILVNLSSAQAGGAGIVLTDANGDTLASFTPAKQYQSVVVSAPGIENGGSYTLAAGSETQTIEMTSLLYGSGAGIGGGQGGGKGGARPSAPGGDATTGAAPNSGDPQTPPS